MCVGSGREGTLISETPVTPVIPGLSSQDTQNLGLKLAVSSAASVCQWECDGGSPRRLDGLLSDHSTSSAHGIGYVPLPSLASLVQEFEI